jgi:hypothetical protein
VRGEIPSPFSAGQNRRIQNPRPGQAIPVAKPRDIPKPLKQFPAVSVAAQNMERIKEPEEKLGWGRNPFSVPGGK